jgi:hypothetical protein
LDLQNWKNHESRDNGRENHQEITTIDDGSADPVAGAGRM